MKSMIVVALFIAAILAVVECGGIGDYGGGLGGGLGGGYGGGLGGGYGGGLGYGKGPKAAVGPNILYGGYTLSSRSVSGPLSKPGLLKTSFLPGKIY